MGGIDLSVLSDQRVPVVGHLFGLFELLIGWLLAAIYAVVPSYGLAIIFLTILIRLILMPVTAKSTKSMAAMQKLQPEIKRLQAKYKSDRQRLNEELMALYKANNVNPAMGCLPLLAQMPVMIALYQVFRPRPPGSHQIPIAFLPPDSQLVSDICPNGVTVPEGTSTPVCAGDQNQAVAQFLGLDLTQSPQEAWRQGFVAFLPYGILMILIVATAYYSQAQMMKRNKNSGQAQPQAMQTVTKIMPLFFGFISFSLPAAVNVYFLTTNIFQIGQQWFMFRKRTDDSEVVVPKAADKKRPATGNGQTRTAKDKGADVPKKKAPQKVPPKSKKGPAKPPTPKGGAGGGSAEKAKAPARDSRRRDRPAG